MKLESAFRELPMARFAARRVLLGVVACVASASQTGAWAATPLGCLIEPDRVAEVGSPVIGVIDSMHVERGDVVRKGQVVAVLRAVVERAAVGVAHTRAQAEADVHSAQANREFAHKRALRAEDLFGKNFISQNALDQARTELDMAEQRLAQAREQQRLAQRELDLARAQLSQRTIRSPIDGIVVERYADVGERIEEKPIVRVAATDPLRVEVVVPAALYGRIQPGAAITITPQLPDAGAYRAKVTLVDKAIDAASNTFRLRLELPNPEGRLPAGLRCKADLGIEPAAASTAAASPSAPAVALKQSTTLRPEAAGQ